MAEIFSAKEIFEMAEQIERNGARFYRESAPKMQPSVSKLFQKLAQMENDHERFFISMRSRLSHELEFDPDGEVARYLHGFVESEIFDLKGNYNAAVNALKSERDALNFALAIEKETVAFYTGIRELVPESLGKADIEHIIREEMMHIAYIRSEIAKLKG